MSESESEADNSDDNDEDRPIFPYEKLYYSALLVIVVGVVGL
jgi:RNA polymerase-associated protein RTF1